VSFAKIPDRMAGYATYELTEKLLVLSAQQRAAIDRIVQHCYIDNRPMAELFRGEDKICAETNYYRRGAIDPDTGGWARKPGWAHDKEFVDALDTAARLALAVRTREEIAALATAKRRARLAASGVISQLIDIATQSVAQPLPDGRVKMLNRMTDDKDSVAASKVLLDYAGTGEAEQADAVTSDETDWWKAASDG